MNVGNNANTIKSPQLRQKENMKINNVEVNVLSNGKPVKFYANQGKTFVCANYGAEYSIRIRNNNSYRILAVCSIDGISIIDGKPASYESGGYVIDAYSSYEIKGYRKDSDTVGAFKFTKKKKGYEKATTGSSLNSGVISVAVFGEKTYWSTPITWNTGTLRGISTAIGNFDYQYPTLDSYSFSRSSLNSNVVSSNAKASNDLDSHMVSNCNYSYSNCSQQAPQEKIPNFDAATTWGKKMVDSVKSVTFEKASLNPYALFDIYYDTKQNLQQIGIVFDQEKKVSFPNSFPGEYATPPAGWGS